MDQGQIIALATFILVVLGAAFAAWWRVTAAIRESKNDLGAQVSEAATTADMARSEVSALRLHVAETYVSMQGM